MRSRLRNSLWRKHPRCFPTRPLTLHDRQHYSLLPGLEQLRRDGIGHPAQRDRYFPVSVAEAQAILRAYRRDDALDAGALGRRRPAAPS